MYVVVINRASNDWTIMMAKKGDIKSSRSNDFWNVCERKKTNYGGFNFNKSTADDAFL